MSDTAETTSPTADRGAGRGPSGAPLKQLTGLVVVLLLAVYFVFSGHDPLGLFSSLGGQALTCLDQRNTVGWDVLFTTGAGGGETTESLAETAVVGRLQACIASAQRTIQVAAFEFDLIPVAEALIAAEQRGVDVQWVTDDEFGLAEDEASTRLFARLRRAGASVRTDDRSDLMHNKFIIIDGEIVWTGSLNLTENGVSRNNNNVLILASPTVASIYGAEFAEMWAGEFGPSSPSTPSTQQAETPAGPVWVYFAPEDVLLPELLALVGDARRSIRFMAFSFTLAELGAAMRTRAADNVVVEGLFETRGSETVFSELRPFYCAGFAVRQDGNPGTMHHKVILIDDRIVITGSLNFSASAVEGNDENVVIIANEAVASLYRQEFNRRWRQGLDPDPADMRCPG